MSKVSTKGKDSRHGNRQDPRRKYSTEGLGPLFLLTLVLW